MIDNVLHFIAPHLCLSCGSRQALLCDSCAFNITQEPYSKCVHCRLPSDRGVCRSCRSTSPFERAWVVGERDDVLKNLLDKYKFARARTAGEVLGGLFHQLLPHLPTETVLVPIPTIARHKRQRGYDHTDIMARSLAAHRRLARKRVLTRVSDTVQFGSSRKQRYAQAEEAFSCPGELDPGRPYLIIEDIITTGATVSAASKILKRAGAAEVWVAAIAHQPV